MAVLNDLHSIRKSNKEVHCRVKKHRTEYVFSSYPDCIAITSPQGRISINIESNGYNLTISDMKGKMLEITNSNKEPLSIKYKDRIFALESKDLSEETFFGVSTLLELPDISYKTLSEIINKTLDV